MLQGSCPSRAAPFFTLHIPAGINSLWLLSALELLNLEVAYRNRVGGKRSSFLPTFVFRPLTPPYVRFRIRRFFILRAI